MTMPSTSQLQTAINEKEVKPALFLDLDGTIRYGKSGTFIKDVHDIALYDGIPELVWKYRNEGYLIIGISNQGGVAHGFKTHQEIDAEMERTILLFDKNPFHDIKWCLHHPDGNVEPYCHESRFRKPDIGMICEAEVDCFNAGFIIDYSKSIFVGDRPEDKECAKRAGIQFMDAEEFRK